MSPQGSRDGYGLSPAQQARMLRKLMLFWDGQWFLKVAEACGLEDAVELNARVRASFGRIEMRELLKALGKKRADGLRDAMDLLETYARAFMGGTLRAEFLPVGDSHGEVTVRRCAAYEGAKQAALPRADQACIACEGVWAAWLGVLLPGARIAVRYPLRQGMGDPVCQFLIDVEPGEGRQGPDVQAHPGAGHRDGGL